MINICISITMSTDKFPTKYCVKCNSETHGGNAFYRPCWNDAILKDSENKFDTHTFYLHGVGIHTKTVCLKCIKTTTYMCELCNKNVLLSELRHVNAAIQFNNGDRKFVKQLICISCRYTWMKGQSEIIDPKCDVRKTELEESAEIKQQRTDKILAEWEQCLPEMKQQEIQQQETQQQETQHITVQKVNKPRRRVYHNHRNHRSR